MESPDTSVAPVRTLPPPLPIAVEARVENPAVLVCGLDSTKLTFGEWWRTSPGLVAVIGWCAKLLGARILDAARVLIVRDAAALEISLDELSEEPRRKILGQVDELRGLGFGEARVMRVTDVFTNRDIVLAVQLHASGKTLARTLYAYPLAGATSKKKEFSVGFLSAFNDGRLLCTDDKPPKMLSAPQVIARWKRGGLAARYRAHEENIDQVAHAAVLPLTNENAWRACDEYESAVTSFGQSRGLLVPLSDAEGAKVVASGSPEEARLAGALAELVRLQTARPRSMAGVVVLVISLVIFAGTGALAWSWQICAVIGVALFVHEVGHYVAMRMFKYRDLRMFFVPLLGAAVTGKHHNVPGWKKAIVSLMGPLPGIVFGTGMAIGAIVLGTPALADAALLVIGLNLFNLLPILPLDGGWFWNAVLFCRHRWLEAGFKSLAGIALIGGTLAGGGGILVALGIGMLSGVPKTLRLGAAAARLRGRGWQPGGDDIISRETAETILSELKQPGKNPPAARTAATDALNVFEHLNARPPKFFASFGLAATYAATIFVALIGLGAAVSADSESRKKISEAITNPAEQTTVLNAEFHGEVAQFSEVRRSDDEAEPSRRLIATFPDSTSAAAVLEKIRAEKIAVDQLVQFGQTLIAVTAYDDETTARELSERFRGEGGTLLDSGDPITFALLNLQFSVRDAQTAARLSRDLHAFFDLPVGVRPLAPWANDDTVKPEQREQYMQSAATYARILEAQRLCDESSELEPLRRSNLFTLFQSAKASRESIEALVAKREQLHREAVKKLRASGDPALDDRVIALVLRQPSKIVNRAQFEAVEEWQGQMRELLTGRREDDRETSTDRYVSARVTVTGQQITLHFTSFQSPEQTLPALARYLANFDCSDVRYGFYDMATPHARRLAALDR